MYDLLFMLMFQSLDEELEHFEVDLHKASGHGIGVVICLAASRKS